MLVRVQSEVGTILTTADEIGTRANRLLIGNRPPFVLVCRLSHTTTLLTRLSLFDAFVSFGLGERLVRTVDEKVDGEEWRKAGGWRTLK